MIAADGSDIHIPTNPDDLDSYFPDSDKRSAYSMLHLDAMYDLLQHTYTDALILGKRKANERSSLYKMIERSPIKNALLILDRGYESYNLMAHAQEKGWNFLVRIQDILSSRSIAAGLDLPSEDEFDVPINLSIFTKYFVGLIFKNQLLFQHLFLINKYSRKTGNTNPPSSTNYLSELYGSKSLIILMKPSLPIWIRTISLLKN